MAGLKTKVDDLDVHKLKSLSAALSKLNNLVNNDVVQRTVYNKLVIKVSVIYIKTSNTSRLVTKTQYDSDRQGLEKNIGD